MIQLRPRLTHVRILCRREFHVELVTQAFPSSLSVVFSRHLTAVKGSRKGTRQAVSDSAVLDETATFVEDGS